MPANPEPSGGRIASLPVPLRPLARVVRPLFLTYRSIRSRGWQRALNDYTWSIDQNLRRARIKLASAERLRAIGQELTEGNAACCPDCLITITFGSRQFGNRDNRLERFLDSFLAMTEKPSRVELLIKVDDDDDLLFFQTVKRNYHGRMNIRFMVSPRGRGYADMHHYHANLLRIRNPSSRMLFVLTEDAVFMRSGWDTELVSILPDRSIDCFIATPASFEDTISIVGPNPALPVAIYWVRGDDFPIFGFGLLDCTGRVAKKHQGWTCLGNLFNIDGFSGDILRRLWQLYQINLHIQVPQFAQRTGVFHWTENPERNRVRAETLIRFFSEENQRIRDEMATAIYHTVAGKLPGSS